MHRSLKFLGILLLLSSCAELPPEPYTPSKGHLSAEPPAGAAAIPDLVEQTPPPVPEPKAAPEQEKYTVVVNEVPVKEILFALARDAKINVDVDPRISGVVTLNAVDQSLPQLLDRIARQVDLRYEFRGDNLFITPDEPFFRTYKIDYLNMARDTDSGVAISTQIASTSGGGETGSGGGGGGGGGNNSTTTVTSTAVNHFWNSLVANVSALLGEESKGGGNTGEIPVTAKVIPHPESGILTVKATAKQHELIQALIDQVVNSAQRQVVIQATIAEVTLNDNYQAGIDWSVLNVLGQKALNITTKTITGGPPNALSSFLLQYTEPDQASDNAVNATLKLLEEFGNIRVLSSPQIMALNNQTAILKVVDNFVYFEVSSQTSQNQTGALQSFQTTAKTVPVGIVMTVTPQVNENDSVILDVRPTISRVSDTVADPNPALTVPNEVPVIQVREMESVLRMNDGQIAILGGLMQDTARNSDTAIPGFSRVPGLGEAFKTRNRENSKTELVIFLRPTVVRNPSLEGDLGLYKAFLDRNK